MNKATLFELNKVDLRLILNVMRGWHPCHLKPCRGIIGEVEINGEKTHMATFELWIPTQDFSKIFVSPSLIIHYMQKHTYLPPAEFIQAVNDFDLTSGWSGKEARNKCIAEVYKTK